MSDRAIAEQVGVSAPMVSRHRQPDCNNVTVNSSQMRTGKDGRTICTANIGRAPAPDTKEQMIVDGDTGATTTGGSVPRQPRAGKCPSLRAVAATGIVAAVPSVAGELSTVAR